MSVINVQVIGKLNPSEQISGGIAEDLNKDGFLDLVLYPSWEVWSETARPFVYMLSNGSASLVRQPDAAFASFKQLWVQRTIATDLNNDGLLDVVSGAAPEQGSASRTDPFATRDNWGSNQYIFIQKPDHTFEPRKIVDDIFEAHSIEVADFNEDGFIDILQVSDLEEDPIILINKGDATFERAPIPTEVSAGLKDGSLKTFWSSAADFNNDGHIDIAFLGGTMSYGYYSGNTTTPLSNFNVIYYGNGKGSFEKGPYLPLPTTDRIFGYISIDGSATIDLNGDSRQDLILWEVYRSDLKLGDNLPEFMRVLINRENGFHDETEKWIGKPFLFDANGDTRSLGPTWLDQKTGYLSYTLNVTENTDIRMPKGDIPGPFLSVPVFLNNTGTQVKTIVDPYWSSLVESSGFHGNVIWGTDTSGRSVCFYKNWNSEIVAVTFDLSDEAKYAIDKTNYSSIDLINGQVTISAGLPFQKNLINKDIITGNWNIGSSKYNQQKDIPHYYKLMDGEGFNFRIGTSARDLIDVVSGTNFIDGGLGPSVIRTGSGKDFIVGKTDGSVFEGGEGLSIVIYGLPRGSYEITQAIDGAVLVRSSAGTDLLYNVDHVAFRDGLFRLNGSNIAPLADTLPLTIGTKNNDRLQINDGAIFDGTEGVDLVALKGNASDYEIEQHDAALVLKNKSSVTTLVFTERVSFADKTFAFDLNGYAGQAYRLYQAALDRTPDERGLAGWIKYMDEGGSLSAMAQSFIDSQEFRTKYGALDDRGFVNQLYLNVLDRNGEASGINGWVNGLANGLSRAEVLKGFSESGENQVNVLGQIQNGIAYTEWWLT